MAQTPALQQQIGTTLNNLRNGTVQRTDRIFLNHILEEFERLSTQAELGGPIMLIAELADEMVGSTRELVEDGLEN